ncbi:MAG: WYL domain-containing protein [Clostridia bacterium]|nr:WYL domain-containing protein [Clostridia bacterium]
MAKKEFNELVKHFQRVRAYMQHFYVYGFYTREEFEGRSSSTFDNEKRRLEGWMNPYYGFRMTRGGKANFISFDSRNVRRNPLYRALKSRSFTEKDIVLHFLILDVLHDGQEHGVQEILHGCLERLDNAVEPMFFEENTLRDKLSEYETLGVLSSRKQGRDKYYHMHPCEDVAPLAAALAFFSEVAPCGVVGSYLEDRLQEPCEHFRMKHHYITQTLDTELMCTLLEAMHASQDVIIVHMGKDGRQDNRQTVTPLYFMRSVQDGRIYLMAMSCRSRGFVSTRLDHISAVKPVKRQKGADAVQDVRELRALYDATRPNRWGASTSGRTPQRITFTIRVNPWEEHVKRRMYRECRTGRVEELEGGSLLRFTAELYDLTEILPWIRSFIGRITEFECESEFAGNRFLDDLAEMAVVYGLDAAEEEVQG